MKGSLVSMQSMLQSLPSIAKVRAIAPAAAAAAVRLSSGDGDGELSGRERRKLRQQRREANAPLTSNWRDQVQDRLLLEAQNKKKNKPSRAARLSINDLTALGPQWWALLVPRSRSPQTAARLARSLSTNFPHLQFKVYNPSIRERKLKDGLVTVKQKPLIPGTMYLHCTLTREVHDSVKGCQGIFGFLGSQTEVSKDEYFTKPTPISANDIEAILLREKTEQENVDKAFNEKEAGDRKPPKSNMLNQANLLPGVSVRVTSGPFADYTSCLKKLDLKQRKATVELQLFGKESSVELDIDQIDAVDS